MQPSMPSMPELGFKVCGIVRSIGLKKTDKHGQEKQSVMLALGDSTLRVMSPPVGDEITVNQVVNWSIRLSCFPDKEKNGVVVMLGYRQ